MNSGPKKFYILTEHDSIDDYKWIQQQFEPDLTYILYPSSMFTLYFRDYAHLLKAHSPDNHDFNSALYALTENKHEFGLYNTLWLRIFSYFTETESILNACDNTHLYFNLSSELLSKHTTTTNDSDILIGPSSNINKDGLYLRGVRDYVLDSMFGDKQMDSYESHFSEVAQIAGEDLPKHQYFMWLYDSGYAGRENEDDFWKYLVKWRDFFYWDFVNDADAYLPAPKFTKILQKSYELYPNEEELRHLPLQNAYRCLVHDAYKQLERMESVESVLLIVPTNLYSDKFVEMYGNTSDEDLVYGAKYCEFDSFIHPRARPLVYSMIGFGAGYYCKRKQHLFKEIAWKRRMWRICRWSANVSTAVLLGVYGAAAAYYNLISGHTYRNQAVAKQIHNLKAEKPRRKWKWIDLFFRRAIGL